MSQPPPCNIVWYYTVHFHDSNFFVNGFYSINCFINAVVLELPLPDFFSIFYSNIVVTRTHSFLLYVPSIIFLLFLIVFRSFIPLSIILRFEFYPLSKEFSVFFSNTVNASIIFIFALIIVYYYASYSAFYKTFYKNFSVL